MNKSQTVVKTGLVLPSGLRRFQKHISQKFSNRLTRSGFGKLTPRQRMGLWKMKLVDVLETAFVRSLDQLCPLRLSLLASCLGVIAGVEGEAFGSTRCRL